MVYAARITADDSRSSALYRQQVRATQVSILAVFSVECIHVHA